MILAGDIGGTKTHLALFNLSGELKSVADEKYVSHQYENLSKIVEVFLTSHRAAVEKACFGIAGPVQNGRCQATNLPWVIDARELSKGLKTPYVWLINDLEAIGYGLSCLGPDELFTLNEGKSKTLGNAALIAAGTGLGEAGLYWDGAAHRPFACEGGHTDFGPRNELEVDLLRYLRKKFDHISYERIVSGPGIYNLYRFLVDTGLEEEPDWLRKKFVNEDPPKVISEAGLKKQCKACERTLEWFISLYGSEAGNLALKLLAVGGVYVGGGIAPKILKAMQSTTFMSAFINKGRFAPLLSEMPIKIVLNDNAGLMGAGKYAQLQR
jgi:glucokinase